MTITLALGCGDYDRIRPLINGEVKPVGVDLIPIILSSPERHRRMLKYEEFDVCELSMSSYLLAYERKKDYLAIPVFPHRRFRHGYIYVREDSTIKTPQDLIGCKVGIRRLQNTASLWVRGILADMYGVSREDISWFTEDGEGIKIDFPEHLSVQRVDEGVRLEDLLLQGELDAIIYPQEPKSLGKPGGTRRLFADYRAEEIRYFQQEKIIPLMHTVVIHQRVLNRYPWVAVEVYKAFKKSRDICLNNLKDQRKSSLIWERNYLDQEMELLGGSIWPYNFRDNERALEKMIEYSLADGLLQERFAAREMFVASTLDYE